MLRHFSLFLIYIYQTFLSKRKGYHCAYRVSTGEVGCSGYGKKVIKRFGFFIGMKLLFRRFNDCKYHSHLLQKHKYNPIIQHHPLHSQKGYVDVDGCDCAGGDSADCDSSNISCCVDGDISYCGSTEPISSNKMSDSRKTRNNQKAQKKKATENEASIQKQEL